jgi:phage gp46-like protein
MIDLAIKKFSYGFDIDFENGDFAICNDLTTAIYMSIFCEKRADQSQIERADLRRGHFSNIFYNLEVGSLFWLYTEQSKRTEENASELEDTITQALNWLIDLNYASDFDVNVALLDDNKYVVDIVISNIFNPSLKTNYNLTA